jgi:hypothetical protein
MGIDRITLHCSTVLYDGQTTRKVGERIEPYFHLSPRVRRNDRAESRAPWLCAGGPLEDAPQLCKFTPLHQTFSLCHAKGLSPPRR